MSLAQRSDPNPEATTYYLWEAPGKPVTVRISHNVVDRLERASVEAFRSISARGSEIGGLLLGSVVAETPNMVSVDEYELITCDYSRGPLFHLSDADMGRLQEALERCNKDVTRAVGFFRSHTRKGLALDAEDLAFMEAQFRDPLAVALLVHPFATKPSLGGFFIWENGQMRGEASYQEFQFQSALLPASLVVQRTPPPPPKAAAPAPQAAPGKPARGQVVPMTSRLRVALPIPQSPQALAPEPPAAVKPAPVEKPAPQEKQAEKPQERPAPQAKAALQEKAKPVATQPERPKPQEKVAEKPQEKAQEKPQEKSAVKPAPARAAVVEEPRRAPAEVAPVPRKDESPFADAGSFDETPSLLQRMKAFWVWGAVAAALVACSGMLFVYPGLLRHSSRPVVPLTLRVEHSAGDLLLTWNRDSDAIRNAQSGVLTISDGELNENHPMARGELQIGSIMYTPVTADVSFRLEVTGPDKSKAASESVRVLRTRPSPMPTEADKKGSPAAPNAAPGAVNTPPAEAVAAEPEPEPATKLAKASRRFNAAPIEQRLRPALPTDMPDAPGLTASNEAGTASVNLGAIIPLQTAVPAPAPGETRAPAVAAAAPSQIRPAELVTRVPPEYPAIALRTRASGEVKVQAVIGVDGKVKSVKVLSGPQVLQRAATDAVRQWTYRPTMLNGKAVESQTEVVLTFNPAR